MLSKHLNLEWSKGNHHIFICLLIKNTRYEAHNAKVKATIPPENLLVWNLKDGWEPLCKFLGKPVPDKPIPRENQTGDLAWGEEYLYEDDMMVKAFGWLLMYIVLIILLIVAIAMAIYLPLRFT